jgi:hypothetical protein
MVFGMVIVLLLGAGVWVLHWRHGRRSPEWGFPETRRRKP